MVIKVIFVLVLLFTTEQIISTVYNDASPWVDQKGFNIRLSGIILYCFCCISRKHSWIQDLNPGQPIRCFNTVFLQNGVLNNPHVLPERNHSTKNIRIKLKCPPGFTCISRLSLMSRNSKDILRLTFSKFSKTMTYNLRKIIFGTGF